METSNVLHKAFIKYYNTLENLGTIDNSVVKSMLVYSFMDDILTGPMRVNITQEDYSAIRKALSCLHKNYCYFEFIPSSGSDAFGKIDLSGKLRYTTEDINRFTMGNIIRKV